MFLYFFSGPLLTRNLGDLVKKENFIMDSEYLTTLLVIVPWLVIVSNNNLFVINP